MKFSHLFQERSSSLALHPCLLMWAPLPEPPWATPSPLLTHCHCSLQIQTAQYSIPPSMLSTLHWAGPRTCPQLGWKLRRHPSDCRVRCRCSHGARWSWRSSRGRCSRRWPLLQETGCRCEPARVEKPNQINSAESLANLQCNNFLSKKPQGSMRLLHTE